MWDPWTENDGFIYKSPPIFIKNITNLDVLNHDIIRILGPDEFTFTISKDFLKMKTQNIKVLRYLNIACGQIYHTSPGP